MSAKGNMIFIDRLREVLREAIENDRDALERSPSDRQAGHCSGLRDAFRLLEQEYRSITGEAKPMENN